MTPPRRTSPAIPLLPLVVAIATLLASTLTSCQSRPTAGSTGTTISKPKTTRPAASEVRLTAPLQWDAAHRAKECAEQPFKFEPDGVPVGTTWIALGTSGLTQKKVAMTVLDIPVPTRESRDLRGEFTLYDAEGHTLATHPTVLHESVQCDRSNRYITTSPPLSEDVFDKATRVEFHLSANFRPCR